MSVRILLDEDVPPSVARGLRQRGIDAESVHEIGRAGQAISDDDQLRFATDSGRVLVTYNRADFQALDIQWHHAGREHAGILWCLERTLPRRDVGAIVRALEAVVTAHDSLADLCLPLTPTRT